MVNVHQEIASGAEVWFAPPDGVAQRTKDFDRLFDEPRSWETAASGVSVFSVTANYLVRAPAASVARFLAFLHQRGIRLDVSISGITADKRVCGDAIEGIVWPAEEESYATQLKARGAEVYSFSFDSPLDAGYLFHGKNACRLTVRETARRLASTVGILRAAYPNAKMIDSDVPTGRPVDEWGSLLG